ncbi:MAG: HAD-IIIA family hydrolase [Planctomycetes bacterium]|nr:HAD-IIIA family hydrolase [Planctomycetota bacterium]MCL4731491.1 HAD-IIIA family hydrolase [Planctomycetota bacterium]
MARRAVFLDRDGTINKQVGYCGDPKLIELLPGAAQAVRRFNELGLLTIVVTNQSAVARGLITEDQVRRVNSEVALQVARESGGRFDAFYYAPFHPTEGDDPRYRKDSDWRKPGGGMLREAAREFGLELAACFMVGDADIDHAAAKDAHPDLLTFQVPSEYASGKADHSVHSLGHAAELIAALLAQDGGRK